MYHFFLGSSSPEEYGDYFAWVEIQPKSVYNWSIYQRCLGDEFELTKYCTDSSFGYNTFVYSLAQLLPSDDAVTALWGNDARIPTYDEFQELIACTASDWIACNGVEGLRCTGPNGRGIFFPAAGKCGFSLLAMPVIFGFYGSGSRYTSNSYDARSFQFCFGTTYWGIYYTRCGGLPIWAVCSGSQK